LHLGAGAVGFILAGATAGRVPRWRLVLGVSGSQDSGRFFDFGGFAAEQTMRVAIVQAHDGSGRSEKSRWTPHRCKTVPGRYVCEV